MFVSQTVLGYLDHAHVDFDLVTHSRASTSIAVAHRAGLPADQVAKAVLLHDEDDLLLAIVPASRRVNTWAVAELTDSPWVRVAEEGALSFVFRDCERGAIPALGEAFGVRSIVDDELLSGTDVYFEAGDHERLVHMSGDQFARLMANQPHGWIST